MDAVVQPHSCDVICRSPADMAQITEHDIVAAKMPACSESLGISSVVITTLINEKSTRCTTVAK